MFFFLSIVAVVVTLWRPAPKQEWVYVLILYRNLDASLLGHTESPSEIWLIGILINFGAPIHWGLKLRPKKMIIKKKKYKTKNWVIPAIAYNAVFVFSMRKIIMSPLSMTRARNFALSRNMLRQVEADWCFLFLGVDRRSRKLHRSLWCH